MQEHPIIVKAPVHDRTLAALLLTRWQMRCSRSWPALGFRALCAACGSCWLLCCPPHACVSPRAQVFDEPDADGVYPAALDTFANMSRVVDTLFARSQKIVA